MAGVVPCTAIGDVAPVSASAPGSLLCRRAMHRSGLGPLKSGSCVGRGGRRRRRGERSRFDRFVLTLTALHWITDGALHPGAQTHSGLATSPRPLPSGQETTREGLDRLGERVDLSSPREGALAVSRCGQGRRLRLRPRSSTGTG